MSNLDLSGYSNKDWQIIHKKYSNHKVSNKDKMFALQETINILERQKINYFISGGTCLGIYRDKKLIEWDDDIDIDVLGDDYFNAEEQLIKYAETNSYSYRKGSNIFHPKINIYMNMVKVSVCRIIRGNFIKNYLYRPRARLPFIYIYPTYKTKFCDIDIRLPNDTIKYLMHLYGENWETPTKWSRDDDMLYNINYHRRGKKYLLLEKIQTLISKLRFK
tara:strand:- start:250 stop:906 length:657 start_codon:yes stop_codon:yes gene_type:complete